MIPSVIQFTEHGDLEQFKIDKTILRSFDKMNIFESTISLLEQFDDRSFVRIFQFSDEEDPFIEGIYGGWPVIGDSVLASREIIAVRMGYKIQLYNIKSREKLNSIDISDIPRYWKLVNNGERIIIVTVKHFYIWDWRSSDPVVYFDVFNDLSSYRILDYSCDSTGKFHFISGLKSVNRQLQGLIQLYSEQHNTSQLITGYCADFCNWKQPGQDETLLLCFLNKCSGSWSIHAAELEDLLEHSNRKKNIPIYGTQYFECLIGKHRENDFPIGIYCSPELPIIHVYSKLGYYNMFDLHTGSSLVEWHFGGETFSVTRSVSRGFMGITRKGKIVSIRFKPEMLLEWISTKISRMDIAVKFVEEHPELQGPYKPFLKYFARFFKSGDYEKAAHVAAVSPQDSLRCIGILNLFMDECTKPGKSPPVDYYLQKVLKLRPTLLDFESEVLIRNIVQKLGSSSSEYIFQWISSKKVTYTLKIRTILQELQPKLVENIESKFGEPVDINVEPEELNLTGIWDSSDEEDEETYEIQEKELSNEEPLLDLSEDYDIHRNEENTRRDDTLSMLQQMNLKFNSVSSSEELLVSSPVFQIESTD